MDCEPTTTNDCHPTERELLELNRNIQSEDPTIRLESVTQMGKLVSSEESPPVTKLVNRGNLAFLLRYLGKHDDPELQIESVGILITFSSEETEGVVNAGGIPPLVGLLDPRNAENLREHGAWALGNIAGDSPQNRDRVLQAGALQPLLHCLTNSQKIGVLRTCSWTLGNLCRGNPPPPFHYLQPAIAVLGALLEAPDDEILGTVCWALSYLTDGSNDQIQAAAVVNERNIVPGVVQLLEYPNPAVLTPALRVIGNIVSGDEDQTQTVLQCPMALPFLKELLSHQSKGVRKETLWALSNLIAGTPQQIQAVIDSGVLGEFETLIQGGGESQISKEILTVLSNASNGATIKQLEEIFLKNVPLFDFLLGSLLKNDDEESQTLAMDGLINILLSASHHPPFPHSFAIQLSQSSFDAIGIVQNLKVKQEDFLEKQTKLLELLEKALAAVGPSVKPAKKEIV